jgi:hypothetical protein
MHGVRVPHAARLRPSEGAISALLAAYWAMTTGPDVFWRMPLTMKAPGNG